MPRPSSNGGSDDRSTQLSSGQQAELYRTRFVQLFAILITYGLVAVAFEAARGPMLAWGDDREHWPRFIALAAMLPVTAAAALHWLSSRTLKKLEPLLLFLIIGEVALETILSRAPVYEVQYFAGFVLLLRVCLLPSTSRRQFVIGLLATLATTVGAYAYLRAVGPVLSPILRPSSGQSGLAFQVLNVFGIMVAYVAIATYATHLRATFQPPTERRDLLGPYRLQKKLSTGGMGEVWLARHEMLLRPAAIKLIRASDSADVSDVATARFEREVQAASALSHSNIVAIYDYGRSDDGRLFYAMELVSGPTLAELVQEHGPLPAGRALRLLAQILDALTEAHRAGIVHRDIKPENIMVARNGSESDFAKLLDFGLAHLRKGRPKIRHTKTGEIAGTPLYMAPEIIEAGSAPDARTDVYSMGALAFFLITGRPPFAGKNATQVLLSHISERAAPPSSATELPVAACLDALILKALEKNPKNRHTTAAAMRQATVECAQYGEWSPEKARDWWKDVGAGSFTPSIR